MPILNNIFPGDQDWQSKISWGGIFGPMQQVQPPVIPTATPPTGSFADKLVGKLNSPAAQLGLRILANNRGGQSVGNVLGQSVLGYQQDQQSQQQSELQRQLLQAQIQRMQKPEEDNSAPVMVMGPDGKPRYVSRKDAVGQQPFVQGSEQPSSVQEWEYFQSLPPEMQKQFLNMKRQPTAPQLTLVNGVPTLVDRINGSQTPLSNLSTETNAKSQMAAASAAGEATGKTRAEAGLDLPRQEMNAQQASQAIEGLLNSEGAPRIFGLQGAFPIVPGTKRADAKAYLDQVKGKTFLEAYNTLKGGGQITEVEGAKAEAAIARLNKAQSWESAQSALKDLKGVIDQGLARARQKAGATNATPTNRIRVDANGNVVR
jgi:hypothetical protein